MIRPVSLALSAASLAVLLSCVPAIGAEEAIIIPPPALDEARKPGQEKAVFAGGCFWGVQGVFQHVNGVTAAVSGYAGGRKEDADYSMVSTGTTGHAEAVEVSYDPAKVTYGQLLQIFFSVAHNPTQLNYQGPDHGTQYRSALFVTNGEQEKIAKAYIAQLDDTHVFAEPIVTEVSDNRGFFPAEAYHQGFLTLNPTYPYILFNDMPKIENLRLLFPGAFRNEPVLVLKAKG